LRAGALGDFGFRAGEDVAQHEAAPGLDGEHVVEAERRRAALLNVAHAQRVEIFALAPQIGLAQAEPVLRRLGHAGLDGLRHPIEHEPGHEDPDIGRFQVERCFIPQHEIVPSFKDGFAAKVRIGKVEQVGVQAVDGAAHALPQ
jgi:hypothetical protein